MLLLERDRENQNIGEQRGIKIGQKIGEQNGAKKMPLNFLKMGFHMKSSAGQYPEKRFRTRSFRGSMTPFSNELKMKMHFKWRREKSRLFPFTCHNLFVHYYQCIASDPPSAV